MRTKILYSVVSDEHDIYLEQTLLSMYSLKKHNPQAYIVLIMDRSTESSLTGTRTEIFNYISDKIVVDVPEAYSKVLRSRYLKTTLRKYVQGDFLFIDSDTIITNKLDDIDNFKNNLGAVKDAHVNLNDNLGVKNIKRKAKLIDWKSFNEYYFNSGVIYVRDCSDSYDFFDTWHKNWLLSVKAGFHQDQPSFNKTNIEGSQKIAELTGDWNCQIKDNGLRYFYSAKIVHYFSSTKNENQDFFLLANKFIFLDIKKNGTIPDKTQEMVDNYMNCISDRCMICSTNDLIFYYSELIQTLKVLYNNYPHIFNMILNLRNYLSAFLNFFKY